MNVRQKENLTRAERRRLTNYRLALEDVNGDLSVLSLNEWRDYQALRLRTGEICSEHGIDLQAWRETMREEHHCEEK